MELNKSIANIYMPDRMRKLPISPKGFPVPWFVAWVDGVPDFRVIGPGKVTEAVNRKHCWLCGGPMGVYKCFVIGPMCTVNRVSSEPPSHLSCAMYSAEACPFLSKPNMRRNDKDMPEESERPAGIMIARNPGVTALWTTKAYKVFRPQGEKSVLFKIDDPTGVMWYAEGRHATRAEVEESIRTGLPTLEAMAIQEGPKAMEALVKQTEVARRYLPEKMP